MRSDFYVYALLDPRKPGKYRYGKLRFDYEPFYVGKGCGKRHDAHFKVNPSKVYNKWKDRKIRRIQKETGSDPIVRILKRDVVESTAFRLEAKAIGLIGRKGSGPLTNLTDGGEGTSGRVASAAQRLKNAASCRRVRLTMPKGRQQLWFKRISEASKRRTLEERAALSKRYSDIQHNLPEDVDAKRRAALSKSNKRYRESMTEEQREAESRTLSSAVSRYWESASDEERKSRSDAIRRGYASKARSEVEAKNQKIANAIKQQHSSASPFDKRMRSFNVMAGVMVRNSVNSGEIDPADADTIKARLKVSAT